MKISKNKQILPVFIAGFILVAATLVLLLSSGYTITGKRQVPLTEKQTIEKMIHGIDRDIQRINEMKQSRNTGKGASL